MSRKWNTFAEQPTPSQFKILAGFIQAILAQEKSKHLKAYIRILIRDQIGPEDANGVVWMLSETSRLARLSPRQKVMARVLHGLLWNHGKVPDSMYVPEDIAAVMLGPLLPNTVTKALHYTEQVWFPEIKKTYLQYAVRFNPDNLKEMAEAMSHFLASMPWSVADEFDLRTFRPLWILCRGGQ